LDQKCFYNTKYRTAYKGKIKKKIPFISAKTIARNTVKVTNRNKLESRRTGIMNVNAKKLILKRNEHTCELSFFKAMMLKNNFLCNTAVCRLLHIYHFLL